MAPVGQVLVATAVPVVTATGGAAWAAWRPPKARLQSAVQHFAAGLVFAAAATELVPDLVREHEALPVVVGFATGIAVMLALGSAARRAESRGDASPIVALTVIAIDVFVDGALIGIGFAEGGSAGLLLTVALSVELVFLGLAVAVAVTAAGASKARIVGTTAAVALLVVVGGLAGVSGLAKLPPAPFSAVLAFATVALLYLVTEELLAEAHETPDTPALTAMFFVGFLVLLLLSFAT